MNARGFPPEDGAVFVRSASGEVGSSDLPLLAVARSHVSILALALGSELNDRVLNHKLDSWLERRTRRLMGRVDNRT